MKPILNLAVVGEAWHGKSTLIGRLLHELGQVSGKLVERMAGLARQLGLEGSCYAFIIDTGLEERRRGHTLDLSAWRPLDLGPFRVKLINMPGLLKYIGNAVPGISQADAALVVLSAPDITKQGELLGLREHLALCSAFGVEQAVMAVNKMDLVSYKRDAFEKAVEFCENLLDELGYRPKAIFVPISALRGENLTAPSSEMPWHDGPTLLEAIKSLEVPERPNDKPLRLPVHRYYDAARAAAGVIRSGILRPGDDVLVLPVGAVGHVESVQSWGRELELAGPGDDVGVRLAGVARYDLKKGSVICGPEGAPRVAKLVEARVRVLGPLELRAGSCPLLCCHEASVPARVEHLWGEGGREVKALASGEVGECLLKPLAPERKGLIIEPVSGVRSMGLFALRMGVGDLPGALTVAIGECTGVSGS